MPPNRIDSVGFTEAWTSRTVVGLEAEGGTVPVNYVGLEQLILNKERGGRAKDLDDLPYLRHALDAVRRRRR